MAFELIRAEDGDRDYLLLLRKRTMVDHLEKAGLNLSEEQHRQAVSENFEHAYLVIDSGDKVGMLKYRSNKSETEIMQLQIHPDFQNKGRGKRLVKQVLSQSKSRTVKLSVLKANQAKLLYESLGFKIIGEDEFEYHMQTHL